MRAALVMLYTVVMPPAEYDRPYTGSLEIQYADPKEVYTKCKARACAVIGKDRCRIIFPADTGLLPRKTLDMLMRHEIAHCNGWRHG